MEFMMKKYTHITNEDIKKLKADVNPLRDMPYAKGSSYVLKTPNESFTLEFRSNNHRVNLYDSAGNKLFNTFLTRFNEVLDEWFESQVLKF